MSCLIKRLALLLGMSAAVCLCPLLSAQTSLTGSRIDFRQVTTHPDMDLAPRLSPDGRWLAYVSRQTYNFDIWIQSTRGGRARQITFNKADDFYPVWYPNSQALAFVSQSHDAAGDIYRIKLKEVEDQLIPREEPQRITTYLGYDAYPTVSPDGKKIAFVSNRSGRDEIWFWNETTGKTNQLTFRGGTHPAWSANHELLAFTSFRADSANQGDIYIMNLSGPQPTGLDQVAVWDERELPLYRVTTGSAADGFPSWSARADRLIFIRFAFDTNQDGLVSPADHGVIWAADIRPAPLSPSDSLIRPLFSRSFNSAMVRFAMPLTSGAEQVMQPCYGADRRIYFSSDRGGNLDIWSIPDSGFVRRMASANEQTRLAEELYPLPEAYTRQRRGPILLGFADLAVNPSDERRLCDRALAFERVIDYAGNNDTLAAVAYYEIALCQLYLHRKETAQRYWHWLLIHYPHEREMAAYAEAARLGVSIRGKVNGLAELKKVRAQLDSLIQKYRDLSRPAAELQMAIGDLYFSLKDHQRAFKEYQRVLQAYPTERDACSQSQLKIGDVYSRFADREEVIRAYLAVIENYPEQRRWMQPARDRILDLLVRDADTDAERIGRYRELVGQYGRVALLAAAAQLRLADLLADAADYRAAIQEYEMVSSLFPALIDEVFIAQMAISQAYLKLGENLAAFNLLQILFERYKTVRPDLAEQTRAALLQALLASADQLKATRDYELALMRYRLARDYDLHSLHAHRGYIEGMYYLKQIRNAEQEYEALLRKHPRDNIITYALGLIYSYRGTERAELYGDPDGLDPRYLVHKSSATIARALSYDYTLVQAYLTLSYNYEMMENYEARRRARPVPVYKKVYRTLTAPVVTLYRTLTFYEETRPKPYYERAIHELNKAIVLNDESKDPWLEAGLALNLANNYYNLGEYGYAKAYEYYHVKLKYDSTFGDPRREALIYEQMGHCALATEDTENGPRYLHKAISLYQQMGKEDHVHLNTKRLALLYEIGRRHDQAIDEYQAAAVEEQRIGRYDDLMRSYRSIAYNYLQMAEPDDAILYARKALELINQGKVKIVKTKSHRVQLGFFGLYFPLPFINLSSAFTRFTTEDEKALIFTILGESYELQKDYGQAIQYLESKLEMFRQREDRWSESIFLNNIGYLFYLKGDADQAWNYFRQSLDLCQDQSITQGVVLNSLSLGRIVSHQIRELQTRATVTLEERKRIAADRRLVAQQINRALQLLDKELPIYARTRCQLLLLLAELTLAERPIRDGDTVAVLQDALARLQRYHEAKVYVDEALQISRERFLHNEETLATFALADLYANLGETVPAYRTLERSRKLALRHGVFEVLWQADVLLGDVLMSMSHETKHQLMVQQDAMECYLEAIATLEAHPRGLAGAFHWVNDYAEQKPYRRAVAYLLKKGDQTGALLFAERMRAKMFYDMIDREEIELNKERHKVFFANARYLHRQLQQLDANLMAGRNRSEVTRRQISAWEDERKRVLQEFNQVLEQVRREIPELETLIHIQTFTLRRLQKRLRPQEVLFYYLQDDSTIVWQITSRQVSATVLPLSRSDIANHFHDGFNRAQVATDSSALLTQLLAPVRQGAAGFQNLIIVPDPDMLLLPWSGLLQAGASEPVKGITVSTSLTAYDRALEGRRLQGHRLYLVEGRPLMHALSSLGYAMLLPAPGQTENSFSAQRATLGLADVIHLRAVCDWRAVDPLQTRLAFSIPRSAPATFALKQLYQETLAANLLCINDVAPLTPLKDSTPIVALERSAIYAGASAVLLSLWSADAKDDSLFFTRFYENLKEHPAGLALALSQKAFTDSASNPGARFQLYGFGGMTPEEENRFAEEGFEEQVRRGHSAFDLQDWNEAVRVYEEARQMARRRDDDSSLVLLEGRILESAVNGGLWSKAIETQSRLLAAAEKQNDLSAVANGYNNLAFFYTQSKAYHQAVDFKNRYIRLTEQYGLKAEEAGALREIGLIYEHGHQPELAKAMYQQALAMYEQLGQPHGAAVCLRDLGRVHAVYLDNYPAALQYHRQAVDILQTLKGATLDLVDAQQNLGLTYEKMGLYKPALSYQEQALALAIELSDERLQAISRQYLANLHWKMGDYYSALQEQNRSLHTFEKLQDTKLQQAALATSGLIALSLGQTHEALAQQQKALDLALKNDDKADQSTIYKNLASAYRLQGRFNLALAQLEQAGRLDSTLQSRRGMAYNLRNLAAVHIEMGDQVNSLQLARQALALSQAIEDSRNQAQCQLVLAMAFQAQAQTDSTLYHSRLAEEQSEKYLMPEITWRACKEQALAYQRQKNISAACDALFKAIEVIESLRSHVKVEDYRAGFMDDKADVYGHLISLLAEQNRSADAWQVVERSRSRGFLDLIGNRHLTLARPEDERWLAHGDSLQTLLQTAESQLLYQLTINDSTQNARRQEAEQEVKTLRQLYTEYLQETAAKNPHLDQVIQVSPIELDQVQAMLPDSTALLEYFFYDDILYSWCITRSGLHLQRVPISEAVLNRQINTLRTALQRQLSIDELCGSLYQTLIKPLALWTTACRHLIIAPYKNLHYLPFTILKDENGQYLGLRYSLSLTPSASVLVHVLRQGEAFRQASIKQAAVLAFGNPRLVDEKWDLPFAGREVKSLTRFYRNVTSYLSERATESRVKEASPPTLLLFSCHGEFDERHPMMSAVLLAADKKNDGRLCSYEIMGLDLSTYLTAISACETGLSTIAGGDEVVGLVRSFLFSGSAAVLSSLWKVDDLATAVLVKRFFRYLAEGDGRAEALRKAQKVVYEQINPYPSYWAAFTLTGDFR